jgi:hypothetical protein
MPQIKKCYVIDCSSSGLTKKTSFHCFPANLELNLQWKEALINHAGSTISTIFFLVKRPFRFVFQQMLNVLLKVLSSVVNIFQQIAF